MTDGLLLLILAVALLVLGAVHLPLKPPSVWLRAAVAALAVLLLPDHGMQAFSGRLLLSASAFGLVAGHSLLVQRGGVACLIAEVILPTGAIGLPLIVGFASGLSFSIHSPHVRTSCTWTLLAGVVLLMTVPCGTSIVRAVLTQTEILQKISSSDGVPIVEPQPNLKSGRMIGALERIIVVGLFLSGDLEAAGLVVAAKGLIRSRDFEHRHLAEYFIVGTLTSVLVALAIGALLKCTVTHLLSGS